jgi:SAM-dependent methyltransferase
LLFQAARCARDMGVLAALEGAPDTGLTVQQIARRAGIGGYAVSVLLDACTSLELAEELNGRYRLRGAGALVLHDPVVRVNFDFTHDVCHQAAFHLRESLEQQRPAGLAELGPWPTVYEGLTQLDEQARRSWFAFDHFYSDRIFHLGLSELRARQARTLLDVGCNTGRFSALASQSLDVVGLDHPAQLKLAEAEVAKTGVPGRFRPHPIDLLDRHAAFPAPFDAVWMSQLLDCFGLGDVESLLQRARAALSAQGRVYVVETFCDRQRSEPSRIALHGTSLYFACVANGTSRMYRADDITRCAQTAGLTVERDRPLGPWHTLLVLRAVP